MGGHGTSDPRVTASRGPRSDLRRTVEGIDRFLPRSRRKLATIAGVSFLGGLTEAAILLVVTGVAFAISQGDSTTSVGSVEIAARHLLFVALVLLAANLVLSLLLGRTIAAVTAETTLNARRETVDAFQRASYQRKTQDRAAVLQEALTTYVDRFTLGFVSLSSVLAAVLSLSSYVITAVVVSPMTSLGLVVLGGLLVTVLRPAAARTRAASRALVTNRRAYAEDATESVLLARELAVFGVTRAAGDELQELNVDVAEHYRRARFLAAVTPRLYQVVVLGVAVVGLLWLSYLDLDNLAVIGAVVILLVRSLSYGQQVLSSLQALSEHRPYIDRLVALLDSYDAEERRVGTIPIGSVSRIELRGVGFGYDPAQPVLDGVDLTIEAGETIGVVGPSGAGKTTFANLLLRLYEPTTGSILVNGVPLRDVADDEWHHRTAVVPQEPRLLHGTISDNIRFLRPLDPAAVERAATEANIRDFALSMPGGFDARVGELGQGLSGGQRQRVCIARALAGGPDLLVLDEPTSALDGDSEAAIQATLEALKGRVTMVIVAHRLSTLRICDRLVVFRGGRVERVGTAEELEAASPYYREALRLAGI